jgi:hypothetical protein
MISVPAPDEHVSFAPTLTLQVPQAAIDAIWRHGLLSDWGADESSARTIPASPSIEVADELASRSSSLRALGASMHDEQWLATFAASASGPAVEGLAMNPHLPDTALAALVAKHPASFADRTAAAQALATHNAAPTADSAASTADALVAARMGHAVAGALTGEPLLAEALRDRMVNATGADSSADVRLVRAAVVKITGDVSIVADVLASNRGVIDLRILAAAASLLGADSTAAARIHAEAQGLARHLGGGISALVPSRERQPLTKDAEDVLEQYEVMSMIDPTPAARRALFWWPCLETSRVDELLDAADIEAVVDWCQGSFQVLPDAHEVTALLTRIDGQRYDELCAEVARRPEPTEEQPALGIATRDPLQVTWRPAAISSVASYLTATIDDDAKWDAAMALVANGWRQTFWELAACVNEA